MASSIISSKVSRLYDYESEELIPGLPNDMALECLLKLPISSHPNLRLVSHLWQSTLSHPSFFSLRRLSASAEHLLFTIKPLSPPSPPSPPSHVEDIKSNLNSDSKENSSSLVYDIGVYNSTRREWGKLGNFTIPTFAQCVSLPESGKMVVLGGWDPATLEPVTSVVVIDLVTGTWREGSPMLTPRSFFACANVGPATVYVAGGHDGRKNALKTAEVYEVETDQWLALPDMAEERDESHGLVLCNDDDDNGVFWVISGYGTESQGRFRSDAEFYNSETNTWTKIDGVWPYPGHTPKSTAVVELCQQQRWISMVGGEVKEFDFKGKEWRGMNLGVIPKSVMESRSISMVDIGEERIMVMGNGEKSGEECKEEEGCGGEGVFMVIKVNAKNNGVNWIWNHVHAPSDYLGFPFSTSHLFI